MRPREMPHPLCCIALDCPGLGARSRAPADPPPDPGGAEGPSSTVAVAGVLCKWTNIGKGWRHRWFSLGNGVLSYSRIRRRDPPPVPEGDGVRLIGSATAMFAPITAASSSSRPVSGCGCRQPQKPVRVVHLKVCERQTMLIPILRNKNKKPRNKRNKSSHRMMI
ncbi:hypothetical protein GW17_00020873 [Ensete ventricosum]|nr:hypothetical protein GW17_00020873 [Ensete ventricosum]